LELNRQLELLPLTSPPRFIAGCDVSSTKLNPTLKAGIVIMKFPELEIVEKTVTECETRFPYIPGLLSFREMPALLSAWKEVKNIPDLIICDGSGTIHPRKFGLACHLGLWLKIPTIGCAKNLLCGEFSEPPCERGSVSEVIFRKEIVGAAVRTKTGVKPLFISPGNLINLPQAVEYILLCSTKYRLPEPIRYAHALSRGD
jgi:deoxyribonuclease V